MTPIIRRTFLVAVASCQSRRSRWCTPWMRCPKRSLSASPRPSTTSRQSPVGAHQVFDRYVRAYAARAIAEFTTNAQNLTRNRNEANVTMAPDERQEDRWRCDDPAEFTSGCGV